MFRILATLAIFLSACTPSKPVRAETEETSGRLIVVSDDESDEDASTARLERIEKLLETFILERADVKRRLKLHNECTDQCLKDYPWSYKSDESNKVQESRRACFDKCPEYPSDVPGAC
jgi:hypothetical protein